jgi:hypothetical protein
MKFIITLFIIIPCFHLIAENRDSSVVYTPTSFEKFIERINYSKKIENQNLIALSYGISELDWRHKDIFSELSKVFLMEIRYGFVRIDNDFRSSDFAYLASETAYFANYSSHMTIKKYKDDGKTTDAWQFGFDFTNGYGYHSRIGRTFFIHSGGLGWAVIDFENLGESIGEQRRYDIFDKKFKFGTDFETGLRHYFNNSFSLDALYRHSIYFPEFLGWKFFGSFLSEIIIQRTIDYFAEDYIERFPNSFPIINWSAKSLVSLLFYELKRESMNFPFDSEPPLSFDNFKIAVSLTF